MTTDTSSKTTTWKIDPSHSLVEFSARHMMITRVKGRFASLSGTIVMDSETPSNSTAEVDIDAASLDTREEKRDGHLKSADFLDVENHPSLTFRSRKIEGNPTAGGGRFKVIGDLTIRGTTREVTLDTTFDGTGTDPWGGERASFSAETKIDRTEFGLTWNQALETGGVLVSNEVRITLEVQAVKQ